MFTWICPTCGREVPPSYDECPDCSGKAKKGEAAAGQPPSQNPVQPAQPVAPPPAPPRQAATRPVAASGVGLPVWLMSILFALAFLGLGAGVYWTVQYFRNRSQAAPAVPVSMETPAGKERARPHPMQKYIEVTGIRFLQDAKKQTQVRFLVVNHSPDDISELSGNVTIWGRTQKSDEEPVGTFSFKATSLGPWEFKDFAAPMNTRLRVYELPDWQNVTAELQLIAP